MMVIGDDGRNAVRGKGQGSVVLIGVVDDGRLEIHLILGGKQFE